MEIKDFTTTAEIKRVNRLMRKALRTGEIVKADSCAWCGSDHRIEGHHPDYNRPTMVVWLCQRCHRKHHADYRNDRYVRSS